MTFVLIAAAGSVAIAPDEANAAQCKSGAPLPASGLCPDQAKALLPTPSQSFTEGLELMGCKPAVNGAAMMGGEVLLYWAAQCSGGIAKVNVSPGAKSAELTVNDSNTGDMKVGTIISSDPAKPRANMLRWARDDMKANGFPPGEIKKCKPRRAKLAGAPDAWVIDEKPTPPPSEDGPRSACGTFGYTEESNAYWLVFADFSWFFDMGQDAYMPFDPNSLTLVTKGTNGVWQKAGSAAPTQSTVASKGAPASTAPSDNFGVVNVTGTEGVEEQPYGQTRGYAIHAGKRGNRVIYCVADRDFEGTMLSIGYDGGQWQLAVPVPSKPGYSGGFEVDGRRQGMSGTAGNGWTFGWIGLPELDALRQGNLMVLDIGRASLDFPLDGTYAAILKVKECVEKLKN